MKSDNVKETGKANKSDKITDDTITNSSTDDIVMPEKRKRSHVKSDKRNVCDKILDDENVKRKRGDDVNTYDRKTDKRKTCDISIYDSKVDKRKKVDIITDDKIKKVDIITDNKRKKVDVITDNKNTDKIYDKEVYEKLGDRRPGETINVDEKTYSEKNSKIMSIKEIDDVKFHVGTKRDDVQTSTKETDDKGRRIDEKCNDKKKIKRKKGVLNLSSVKNKDDVSIYNVKADKTKTNDINNGDKKKDERETDESDKRKSDDVNYDKRTKDNITYTRKTDVNTGENITDDKETNEKKNINVNMGDYGTDEGKNEDVNTDYKKTNKGKSSDVNNEDITNAKLKSYIKRTDEMKVDDVKEDKTENGGLKTDDVNDDRTNYGIRMTDDDNEKNEELQDDDTNKKKVVFDDVKNEEAEIDVKTTDEGTDAIEFIDSDESLMIRKRMRTMKMVDKARRMRCFYNLLLDTLERQTDKKINLLNLLQGVDRNREKPSQSVDPTIEDESNVIRSTEETPNNLLKGMIELTPMKFTPIDKTSKLPVKVLRNIELYRQQKIESKRLIEQLKDIPLVETELVGKWKIVEEKLDKYQKDEEAFSPCIEYDRDVESYLDEKTIDGEIQEADGKALVEYDGEMKFVDSEGNIIEGKLKVINEDQENKKAEDDTQVRNDEENKEVEEVGSDKTDVIYDDNDNKEDDNGKSDKGRVCKKNTRIDKETDKEILEKDEIDKELVYGKEERAEEISNFEEDKQVTLDNEERDNQMKSQKYENGEQAVLKKEGRDEQLSSEIEENGEQIRSEKEERDKQIRSENEDRDKQMTSKKKANGEQARSNIEVKDKQITPEKQEIYNVDKKVAYVQTRSDKENRLFNKETISDKKRAAKQIRLDNEKRVKQIRLDDERSYEQIRSENEERELCRGNDEKSKAVNLERQGTFKQIIYDKEGLDELNDSGKESYKSKFKHNRLDKEKKMKQFTSKKQSVPTHIGLGNDEIFKQVRSEVQGTYQQIRLETDIRELQGKAENERKYAQIILEEGQKKLQTQIKSEEDGRYKENKSRKVERDVRTRTEKDDREKYLTSQKDGRDNVITPAKEGTDQARSEKEEREAQIRPEKNSRDKQMRCDKERREIQVRSEKEGVDKQMRLKKGGRDKQLISDKEERGVQVKSDERRDKYKVSDKEDKEVKARSEKEGKDKQIRLKKGERDKQLIADKEERGVQVKSDERSDKHKVSDKEDKEVKARSEKEGRDKQIILDKSKNNKQIRSNKEVKEVIERLEEVERNALIRLEKERDKRNKSEKIGDVQVGLDQEGRDQQMRSKERKYKQVRSNKKGREIRIGLEEEVRDNHIRLEKKGRDEEISETEETDVQVRAKEEGRDKPSRSNKKEGEVQVIPKKKKRDKEIKLKKDKRDVQICLKEEEESHKHIESKKEERDKPIRSKKEGINVQLELKEERRDTPIRSEKDIRELIITSTMEGRDKQVRVEKKGKYEKIKYKKEENEEEVYDRRNREEKRRDKQVREELDGWNKLLRSEYEGTYQHLRSEIRGREDQERMERDIKIRVKDENRAAQVKLDNEEIYLQLISDKGFPNKYTLLEDKGAYQKIISGKEKLNVTVTIDDKGDYKQNRTEKEVSSKRSEDGRTYKQIERDEEEKYQQIRSPVAVVEKQARSDKEGKDKHMQEEDMEIEVKGKRNRKDKDIQKRAEREEVRLEDYGRDKKTKLEEAKEVQVRSAKKGKDKQIIEGEEKERRDKEVNQDPDERDKLKSVENEMLVEEVRGVTAITEKERRDKHIMSDKEEREQRVRLDMGKEELLKQRREEKHKEIKSVWDKEIKSEKKEVQLILDEEGIYNKIRVEMGEREEKGKRELVKDRRGNQRISDIEEREDQLTLDNDEIYNRIRGEREEINTQVVEEKKDRHLKIREEKDRRDKSIKTTKDRNDKPIRYEKEKIEDQVSLDEDKIYYQIRGEKDERDKPIKYRRDKQTISEKDRGEVQETLDEDEINNIIGKKEEKNTEIIEDKKERDKKVHVIKARRDKQQILKNERDKPNILIKTQKYEFDDSDKRGEPFKRNDNNVKDEKYFDVLTVMVPSLKREDVVEGTSEATIDYYSTRKKAEVRKIDMKRLSTREQQHVLDRSLEIVEFNDKDKSKNVERFSTRDDDQRVEATFEGKSKENYSKIVESLRETKFINDNVEKHYDPTMMYEEKKLKDYDIKKGVEKFNGKRKKASQTEISLKCEEGSHIVDDSSEMRERYEIIVSIKSDESESVYDQIVEETYDGKREEVFQSFDLSKEDYSLKELESFRKSKGIRENDEKRYDSIENCEQSDKQSAIINEKFNKKLCDPNLKYEDSVDKGYDSTINYEELHEKCHKSKSNKIIDEEEMLEGNVMMNRHDTFNINDDNLSLSILSDDNKVIWNDGRTECTEMVHKIDRTEQVYGKIESIIDYSMESCTNDVIDESDCFKCDDDKLEKMGKFYSPIVKVKKGIRQTLRESKFLDKLKSRAVLNLFKIKSRENNKGNKKKSERLRKNENKVITEEKLVNLSTPSTTILLGNSSSMLENVGNSSATIPSDFPVSMLEDDNSSSTTVFFENDNERRIFDMCIQGPLYVDDVTKPYDSSDPFTLEVNKLRKYDTEETSDEDSRELTSESIEVEGEEPITNMWKGVDNVYNIWTVEVDTNVSSPGRTKRNKKHDSNVDTDEEQRGIVQPHHHNLNKDEGRYLYSNNNEKKTESTDQTNEINQTSQQTQNEPGEEHDNECKKECDSKSQGTNGENDERTEECDDESTEEGDDESEGTDREGDESDEEQDEEDDDECEYDEDEVEMDESCYRESEESAGEKMMTYIRPDTVDVTIKYQAPPARSKLDPYWLEPAYSGHLDLQRMDWEAAEHVEFTFLQQSLRLIGLKWKVLRFSSNGQKEVVYSFRQHLMGNEPMPPPNFLPPGATIVISNLGAIIVMGNIYRLLRAEERHPILLSIVAPEAEESLDNQGTSEVSRMKKALLEKGRLKLREKGEMHHEQNNQQTSSTQEQSKDEEETFGMGKFLLKLINGMLGISSETPESHQINIRSEKPDGRVQRKIVLEDAKEKLIKGRQFRHLKLDIKETKKSHKDIMDVKEKKQSDEEIKVEIDEEKKKEENYDKIDENKIKKKKKSGGNRDKSEGREDASKERKDSEDESKKHDDASKKDDKNDVEKTPENLDESKSADNQNRTQNKEQDNDEKSTEDKQSDNDVKVVKGTEKQKEREERKKRKNKKRKDEYHDLKSLERRMRREKTYQYDEDENKESSSEESDFTSEKSEEVKRIQKAKKFKGRLIVLNTTLSNHSLDLYNKMLNNCMESISTLFEIDLWAVDSNEELRILRNELNAELQREQSRDTIMLSEFCNVPDDISLSPDYVWLYKTPLSFMYLMGEMSLNEEEQRYLSESDASEDSTLTDITSSTDSWLEELYTDNESEASAYDKLFDTARLADFQLSNDVRYINANMTRYKAGKRQLSLFDQLEIVLLYPVTVVKILFKVLIIKPLMWIRRKFIYHAIDFKTSWKSTKRKTKTSIKTKKKQAKESFKSTKFYKMMKVVYDKLNVRRKYATGTCCPAMKKEKEFRKIYMLRPQVQNALKSFHTEMSGVINKLCCPNIKQRRYVKRKLRISADYGDSDDDVETMPDIYKPSPGWRKDRTKVASKNKKKASKSNKKGKNDKKSSDIVVKRMSFGEKSISTMISSYDGTDEDSNNSKTDEIHSNVSSTILMNVAVQCDVEGSSSMIGSCRRVLSRTDYLKCDKAIGSQEAIVKSEHSLRFGAEVDKNIKYNTIIVQTVDGEGCLSRETNQESVQEDEQRSEVSEIIYIQDEVNEITEVDAESQMIVNQSDNEGNDEEEIKEKELSDDEVANREKELEEIILNSILYSLSDEYLSVGKDRCFRPPKFDARPGVGCFLSIDYKRVLKIVCKAKDIDYKTVLTSVRPLMFKVSKWSKFLRHGTFVLLIELAVTLPSRINFSSLFLAEAIVRNRIQSRTLLADMIDMIDRYYGETLEENEELNTNIGYVEEIHANDVYHHAYRIMFTKLYRLVVNQMCDSVVAGGASSAATGEVKTKHLDRCYLPKKILYMVAYTAIIAYRTGILKHLPLLASLIADGTLSTSLQALGAVQVLHSGSNEANIPDLRYFCGPPKPYKIHL